MFLWAFLAVIRLSVNLYLHEPKEAFHPDILIMGALVTATLACYVIEVLRPGFLTCKRFSYLSVRLFSVGWPTWLIVCREVKFIPIIRYGRFSNT